MTTVPRRLALGLGVLAGLLLMFLLEEHARGRLAWMEWRGRESRHSATALASQAGPSPTAGKALHLSPDEFLTRFPGAGSAVEPPLPMRWVAPGCARVAWALPRWQDYGWAETWESLTNQIPLDPQGLELLRRHLTNQPITLVGGSRALEPPPAYLNRLRTLVQRLRIDTLLELHARRPARAAEDVAALLTLVGVEQSGRSLADHLLRATLAYGGVSLTWEALQASGWSDGPLAHLQAAWQAQQFVAPLIETVEFERVLAPAQTLSHFELADRLRAMGWPVFLPARLVITPGGLPEVWDNLQGFMESGAEMRLSVFIALWQIAWADQNRLFYDQALAQRLRAARRAAAQQDWRLARPPGPPRSPSGRIVLVDLQGNPLGALGQARYWLAASSLPRVDAALGGAARAETLRALSVAAIALKRYEVRHGRLPTALPQLVPEFLARVPRDFMDGQPLRYRPRPNGGFLLYSVGDDGHDDGGDARPTITDPPGVLSGRDWVWPIPATPAQLQAEDGTVAFYMRYGFPPPSAWPAPPRPRPKR